MNCGSAGQQSARPEKATKADSLQEKVQRLQRNIDNLEEDSERIQAEQRGAQFDLQNSDAIADKLVELENRLALLEERVDFIDSTKFNLMTRFERLENRVQTTPTSPLQAREQSPRAVQQPSGAGMSESEYQAAYQQAYNLYQNRNYERAMSAFTRVIQARPNGDLSDNAQYWIGECYYALQNYTRAIVEFEKVFTFTESNKDDDAQLKLGLCYLNLGQRQKAREEFRRLVDFYPTSEYKDKAVEYINQL
jgi:tol-pal system protein YbgF